MKEGALLDLIFTKKEEQHKHVKVESSLDYSKQKMTELRIPRGGNKANYRITILNFRSRF